MRPTEEVTAGMKRPSLSNIIGPPKASLCPPGECQFTAEFSGATLTARAFITHDVMLLTFGLADSSRSLGLSTCACILAKIMEEGNPEPVVRPYTPISTNSMIGAFQLVIKVYDMGKMSQHMKNMAMGSTIDFKHIDKNVKVQYPFIRKNITVLVGGTCITPVIQMLNAILGTESDTTKVTVIFGNKTQDDILCRDILETWSSDCGADRLKVVHVLSEADTDKNWTGEKGFINKEIIAKYCPPPTEDVQVFVVGPPPMYNALCGPRDTPELTGILNEMGYTAEQVYKF
jgi:cytochrome-b5 reductase